MTIAISPVTSATETKAPPTAPAAGRERRESERAIAYWESKIAKLGRNATVAALDLGEIHSEDWSHRFVIAVDPVAENSALLLYGSDFARLLDLPSKSSPHVPMARQLPKRFSDVFTRGCGDAHDRKQAVRLEGEVERADGYRELFRAAFIPIGVKENSLTHLAFGAFNSRIEPAMAA
jgi:hypothetical protein